MNLDRLLSLQADCSLLKSLTVYANFLVGFQAVCLKHATSW